MLTVTVGKKQTEAGYFVENVGEVEALLLDVCNALSQATVV